MQILIKFYMYICMHGDKNCLSAGDLLEHLFLLKKDF